ncbi:response regulator [Geobacter sulfurreducens]|jgi:two-component system cell cycle response regulator DivK|uniref:response regulator n=1 Tax=Geobacter sulfurreducens TaxID=35554 RepID=UPI0001D8F39B|nr:response regulator [Geobacter sulfurreducens]ADI83749.1 response receiver [Geobacter sulfurreducens KN400]AJY70642.1 histidine kinase [Geobacter sulfurreducens]QVW36146.1 response regulator [Geobacter sulfurreducens]UTG93585.1 response regulator [Geobacter sulfurreducens]BBA69444.1 Signal transduction histidine-protein kinase BarA [Geobacter sulfurreducens]
MTRQRTILIVDDNFMNRRLVAAMLNGTLYRLVEKDSGREGLDYALNHREELDLVLLDIGMPDISGTEVCRSIREHETRDRLPVIAYTAHAMSEERRSFLNAGFDDILIKPITRNEFLAVLEKHLN